MLDLNKNRRKQGRADRRLAVSVALAVTLVSLFFLLQIAPHSHTNGQDDRACRLCQVAHIGIVPAVSATLLSIVLLYFGEIRWQIFAHFAEPSFSHSPSRAPPTLAC